jgi:sulfatase modifying factor 1
MTDDLSWIPAQTYAMGSDRHYPEEGPVHQVSVDGFWIESHQVTNAQFAGFVEATGYVTVAERPLDPADFPGAPAENLQPGSMVFTRTAGPVNVRHISLWWTWTPSASWRHPEGPASSIDGREDHPVVHIAYEDVEAYAAWIGRNLPTEAEWEAAARGGAHQMIFIWGDEPEPAGERLANFWHDDSGRLLPTQRVRPLRHGGQRLGVDFRLVRRPPLRHRSAVLHPAQPARQQHR